MIKAHAYLLLIAILPRHRLRPRRLWERTWGILLDGSAVRDEGSHDPTETLVCRSTRSCKCSSIAVPSDHAREWVPSYEGTSQRSVLPRRRIIDEQI